jgi:hypothetical protein
MNALPLLQEGAANAAHLAALLFSVPLAAQAAEPPGAATAATASELRVIDAAFEMRVLGLLADLRVVQAVRNDGGRPFDLGAPLAAASEDDRLDRLAVMRDGRSIDLRAPLGGCGDDDDPQGGHAVAALDEALADLTQLAPGQRAEVEYVAAATLQPAGDAYRMPLPATLAPLAAHARLVTNADAPTLVVVTPGDAAGRATLTLRPLGHAPRVIELGAIAASTAVVLPLADAALIAALADGAIELEIAEATRIVWTTLPVGGDIAPATLARAD